MLPQAPLQAVSPPTTLSRSYLPSDHASSTSPTILFEAQTTHHDAVRIARTTDLGSTAKGIMIGIFSVLGAAGVCLIIAAIVYYFRYTQQGRIFLDRLSRPGEYDDEQQFAKEEAEALEDMDDLQRTEYMRAKGTSLQLQWYTCDISGVGGRLYTNVLQHSSRQTRLSPFKPTYPYRNSWQYKKRVFLHGSSSLSLRSQTALSKPGPRLNSLIPNVASKVTYPYRNRMRCTTGRPRCMRSQKLQA